ncbi:MAG: hypothetical protein ABSF95_21450 [Verrucomicrobiota bacterium]|jgi:hypothetical protein
MRIEQPAGLNKHVDPSIPLTWVFRWQELKPLLPLLVCCGIVLVEQVVFRLWLNDRSLISELPLLLVCALTPLALWMAAVEAQVRVAHRTKRTIKLEPKRLSISPAKHNRIAWNQIVAWRLEPLANAPEFSKLTLEYSLGKKGKLRREWSMVLRQPDQQQAFLSELEHLRQVGSNPAPVIQLPEPCLPRASRRHLRGMVMLALGFWCLVHGLPLLGVGLLPPGRRPDEPRSASEFTPKETAKLQRTVTRLFPSREQYRLFLLVTGGGMTALGLGLYFRGGWARAQLGSAAEWHGVKG